MWQLWVSALGALAIERADELHRSCAYSVALDVGRSCADECMNVCGIQPGSFQSWLIPEESTPCMDRLMSCSIPTGFVGRLQPAEDQTENVLMQQIRGHQADVNLDNFTRFDELHTPSASTSYSYSVRKLMYFDIGSLKAKIDPWRLTYLSLKRNWFVRHSDERHCTHVQLGFLDFKDVWRNDPGTGYTLGCARNRTTEHKEVFVDDDRAKGVYVHSPNFAPLVQQFFMRNFDQSRLYMGVAAITSLTTNEKQEIELKVPNYSGERLTAYELEAFSTGSWKVSVPPECSLKTDCERCTITNACNWCDMSNAPAPMWGLWHAESRSSQLDGSSCGVSPSVCALMGGEPYASSCPLQRNPKTLYN